MGDTNGDTNGDHQQSNVSENSRKRRKMGYTGHRLSQQDVTIDCIGNDDEMPDPPTFFQKYVRTRRPVKIHNALRRQDEWKSLWKLTDLQHLLVKAGQSQVHVERRETKTSRFGRPRSECEVVMTFAEFLRSEDRCLLYLSTQPMKVDDEGRPKAMHEPVVSLKGDVPLYPSLGGNLIPMSYNLWMGSSSSPVVAEDATANEQAASSAKPRPGSTSGLHHDFHDNFYCLLAGRKHFRLYSPDQAHAMKTKGTIRTVHPNGLINYEGDDATNENGANLNEHKAWEAKRKVAVLEEEVSKAEAAVDKGEEDAEQRLEKAEADLEAALEAVLEAQMELVEDGDDYEDGSADGDGVGISFNSFGGGKDDDDDDEEDADFWSVMNAKKAKGEDGSEELKTKLAKNLEKGAGQKDFGDGNDDGGNDDDDRKMTAAEKTENQRRPSSTTHPQRSDSDAKTEEKMNNFSLLGVGGDNSNTSTLPKAEVELEAGDILYLPTGWFHEVTSSSLPPKDTKQELSTDARNDNMADMHVAFNYWFHPPSTASTFEAPYASSYLEEHTPKP